MELRASTEEHYLDKGSIEEGTERKQECSSAHARCSFHICRRLLHLSHIPEFAKKQEKAFVTVNLLWLTSMVVNVVNGDAAKHSLGPSPEHSEARSLARRMQCRIFASWFFRCCSLAPMQNRHD